MNAHNPEFRMSIDVTLSGSSESDPVDIDLIKRALDQVTSHMRFGTKEQTGRVLDEKSIDFNGQRVTVDVTYIDARRAIIGARRSSVW